jgi:hypothetical protein
MLSKFAWLGVFLLPGFVGAQGFPVVTVVPTVGSSTTSWAVSVTPRVSGFTPGTSLAVELDFEFTGDIAGATLNESFWNVNGTNPGNNPFTGTQTAGIAIGANNKTLFVSAGSELFTTATPMLLMTVETTGTTGAFSRGGRTALPGTPQAYPTSRIAQNGVNYDGITGTCVCGPDIFLPGDFDGNGSIGNGDLTLMLDNWGETVPPSPVGWIGWQPTAPGIGNDELTYLLDGWGTTAGLPETAAAVPEPAALLLATVLLIIPVAHRRRQS